MKPKASLLGVVSREIAGLMLFAVVFVAVTASSLPAQTFTVLHTFTAGGDGYFPTGLAMDQAGSLYGAASGGTNSAGIVFKMQLRNSTWTLAPLYNFAVLDGNDGAQPVGVAIGPGSRPYGTTSAGGINDICGPGCGTVFALSPPASFCGSVLCLWNETQLHAFEVFADGAHPANADLIFDQAGNIYGTTLQGNDGGTTNYCGEFGCGTLYKLTRSGGTWTNAVLYDFGNGSSYQPIAGVIFDAAGNAYGTASGGGSAADGTVYELTPGSPYWTETVLHSFQGASDGEMPAGTLVKDAAGNLYGTTQRGGPGNGGTVFELSNNGGSWTFSLIYAFSGPNGPAQALTLDAAGNVYGTTTRDGAFGKGNVFKLTRVNGSWTYTSLYDFTGGSDGSYPSSKLLLGPTGNLIGSTFYGGEQNSECDSLGCGVVFQIAPR